MTNVEQFEKIVADMATTYKKKNADYGNSFEQTLNKWGINVALARIEDKLNRVTILTKQEAQIKDEAIEDTLKDLATYAIMTLMWINNNTKENVVSQHNKNIQESLDVHVFDYLLNKTVRVKGGLKFRGFPSKPVFGTICDIAIKDNYILSVKYNNIISYNGNIIGSGMYDDEYPINELSKYGLDKETLLNN